MDGNSCASLMCFYNDFVVCDSCFSTNRTHASVCVFVCDYHSRNYLQPIPDILDLFLLTVSAVLESRSLVVVVVTPWLHCRKSSDPWKTYLEVEDRRLCMTYC